MNYELQGSPPIHNSKFLILNCPGCRLYVDKLGTAICLKT